MEPKTPTAPVAPVAPTTPTAPAAPDISALTKQLDDYKARVEAADRKLRVNRFEMEKFTKDKQGIGAKLSAHDAMDKALKAAGVTVEDLAYFKANPEPVLKKALGEKYYDLLTERRISGGAMTAEAVAAEIERAKNDVRSEFEKKAADERSALEKSQQEQWQSVRQQLHDEAGQFIAANGKDYPLFEGAKPEAVQRALAEFVEADFRRTGNALTMKQAADKLEEMEIARAERLYGIEKYKEKLTAKSKPAPTGEVGAPQARRTDERRTLSNDLSASTAPAKRTSRTDEERRAAVLALALEK